MVIPRSRQKTRQPVPELQKQACVAGCPVNVRIPEFIAAIMKGNYEDAYEILTSTNSLPAVCDASAPRKPSASRNASAVLKASR